MDLRVGATWFDDTVGVDAYGTDTFKCQIEPLDYYKLDGASVKRRIMSTGAGVTLPARMTIRIDDQVYLVGDRTPEHFRGDLVRNRYVMSGADSQVTVRTLQQALNESGGTQVWATLVFTKIQTDERYSSLPVAEFRVFLGSQETLLEHNIVIDGSSAYLVVAPYKSDSGLMSGVALRLEYPVPEAATYKTTIYDPISDTTVDTTVSAKIIRMRWAQDFEFLSASTPTYQHGDQTVFGLSSIFGNVKPNQRITVAGEEWTVVTSNNLGAVTRMHTRR